jgi:hypothetical protein
VALALFAVGEYEFLYIKSRGFEVLSECFTVKRINVVVRNYHCSAAFEDFGDVAPRVLQYAVPDYDIVLDTDYLDKLQGKELLDFIKANAEKVDGYLFGGEAILSYVETMFGEELTSEPDDNGNRFQRDCFAHNLTKVSERLKFI